MTASMRLTATVRCVACPWEETLSGDVCAIARVLAGAYARHLAAQHPEQLANLARADVPALRTGDLRSVES